MALPAPSGPSRCQPGCARYPSAPARAHEGPGSHNTQLRRDGLLSVRVSPCPLHLRASLAWALGPSTSRQQTGWDPGKGKAGRGGHPIRPVLTTATSTALAPEDGRSQSSTSRRSRATALVAGRARIPEQMAPTVVPWAERQAAREGDPGGWGPRLPHGHVAGRSQLTAPRGGGRGCGGSRRELASQSPPAPTTGSRGRGGGGGGPEAPSPHSPACQQRLQTQTQGGEAASPVLSPLPGLPAQPPLSSDPMGPGSPSERSLRPSERPL